MDGEVNLESGFLGAETSDSVIFSLLLPPPETKNTIPG